MLGENWSRLKAAKPKTYLVDLQPVPGVGREFCIPLAKFQAEIPLFKYLPKETLIYFARLIPIWIKSAEFKPSADSEHCKSYFGYETRKRVVPYVVH